MISKIYKISAALIGVIALTVLAVVVTNRWQTEKRSDKVEIILDYSQIQALEDQSIIDDKPHQTEDWWLKEFKEMGATSVALFEDSIQSLALEDDGISIDFAKNIILNNIGNENGIADRLNQHDIDMYDVLVGFDNKMLFDRVIGSYEQYYSDLIMDTFEVSNRMYLLLDGTLETAAYYGQSNAINSDSRIIYSTRTPYYGEIILLGVGYDNTLIDRIHGLGFQIVPRPNFALQSKYDKVEIYEDNLDKYNLTPTIYIMADTEVLGYPDNQKIWKFVNLLSDRDIHVGLLETNVQRQNAVPKGSDVILRAFDGENLVRLFTSWDYIQAGYKKYGYEGAEENGNFYYRAVTERNIRAILFKPFTYDKLIVTDIEPYHDMFETFEERLVPHGLSFGSNLAYEKIEVGYLSKVFITLGVLVAGLILLQLILPLNYKYMLALLALGVIGVFGVYYVAPNTSVTLFSLITTIVFSCLSIKVLDNYLAKLANTDKKNTVFSLIKKGTSITVICSLISVLGGVILFGLMAHTDYILENQIFRGVKVSQMIPLVVTAFYCLLRLTNQEIELSVKGIYNYAKNIGSRFLNHPIKVKYVILFALVSVIGYIYIARTGHETNVQPPIYEILLRNFFENNLLARPRNKEFLFAFPATVAAVYFAYHYKYKIMTSVLMIVAAIGQASILNTFSHQRTPLYLSLIRTVYSNIFGILIGILAVIGVIILEKMYRAVVRKLTAVERV